MPIGRTQEASQRDRLRIGHGMDACAEAGNRPVGAMQDDQAPAVHFHIVLALQLLRADRFGRAEARQDLLVPEPPNKAAMSALRVGHLRQTREVELFAEVADPSADPALVSEAHVLVVSSPAPNR
jgi:hypothetical protein